MDRTICETQSLKTVISSLEKTAAALEKHCPANPQPRARRLQAHAAWLSDVTRAFAPPKAVSASDYLGSVFTQRADLLAETQIICAPEPVHAVARVRIETVALPKNEQQGEPSEQLLVRTEPAFIGERINAQLWGELAQIDPPASTRLSDIQAVTSANPPPANEPPLGDTTKVSVVRQTSRYLLLDVETNGCAMKCWSNTEQQLFDLRSGERVAPEELLHPPRRYDFNRLTKRLVVNAISELRQREATRWDEKGKKAFDECARQGDGDDEKDGRQIHWLAGNTWQVHGPACTGEGDAMPPAISSKPQSIDMLAPYLSAYAKSLLLGSGDVRAPVRSLASCPKPGRPPDPQRFASRVMAISASSDHAFLREASGRVWGWGDYRHGKLPGAKEPEKNYWAAPFVIGENYTYAGAGLGFSAVLNKDGKLFTAGSGYSGRLGDGVADRVVFTQIGENFTAAHVDNSGGWALDRTGRLWSWGGESRPQIQVVAEEIAQVSGDFPMLALRRDGNLWAHNEWNWKPPRQETESYGGSHWHGKGFTRLARNLHLAWRADGSAWAWGRTLSAMSTPSATAGLGESPWPRLLGRDWVDIKASADHAAVAAMKTDGSVWVSAWSGRKTRMQRLACGFVDMAFAYAGNTNNVLYLLGLRADGSLLGYKGGPRSPNLGREILEARPMVLARNVVKLFAANDRWGSSGGAVFVLKKDGTVWQWHANRGHRYPHTYLQTLVAEDTPAEQFVKIDFPENWLKPVGTFPQPQPLSRKENGMADRVGPKPADAAR